MRQVGQMVGAGPAVRPGKEATGAIKRSLVLAPAGIGALAVAVALAFAIVGSATPAAVRSSATSGQPDFRGRRDFIAATSGSVMQVVASATAASAVGSSHSANSVDQPDYRGERDFWAAGDGTAPTFTRLGGP